MRPALLLLVLLAAVARGHPAAASEMAEAAQAFLSTLRPDQRAKAALDLADPARLDWKFVPAERKGLYLRDMDPAQREKAAGLLRATLSSEGLRKVEGIRMLEGILRDMEKDTTGRRDPDKYAYAIFGTPSAKGTWSWRLEGHHLEVLISIAEGHVVGLTPHFMGTAPGKVPAGPHDGGKAGLELLGDEDRLGRELALSLDSEQAKLGWLPGKAPADILSGQSRQAKRLEPAGIALGQLRPDQKAVFWKLVALHAERFRGDLAKPVLDGLRALPEDKLYFAYIGGTKEGEGRYYRIQAPELLIEMDNTQNKANHVHSVWRDLRHDFGGDALRRHLERDHGAR
jgi:hypothetical protein